MTSYPRYPGAARFRIEAGRPSYQTDVIVDQVDDMHDALEACHGVSLRQDVCRGIIVDQLIGTTVEYLSNTNCTNCSKCPGRRTIQSERAN